MTNKSNIIVQNTSIGISKKDQEDYICLTDMANAKESKSRAADIIKNWLRNRYTLEFLGIWEQINNPNFKVVEFDHFKMQAGLPNFVLSISEWTDKTNAIGFIVKKGKYGGTYAHKDIAFEFGSAISVVFKLYLIKEYQRLKEFENNQYHLEWSVKRILSKTNYQIHTDAIKSFILPKLSIEKQQEAIIYAEEADILNLALFNCTAKQWREANQNKETQVLNIRDIASINELTVLSNLENLNAQWIKENVSKQDRFLKLKEIVNYQLEILNKQDILKSLKKEELKQNIQNKIKKT